MGGVKSVIIMLFLLMIFVKAWRRALHSPPHAWVEAWEGQPAKWLARCLIFADGWVLAFLPLHTIDRPCWAKRQLDEISPAGRHNSTLHLRQTTPSRLP